MLLGLFYTVAPKSWQKRQEKEEEKGKEGEERREGKEKGEEAEEEEFKLKLRRRRWQAQVCVWEKWPATRYCIYI